MTQNVLKCCILMTKCVHIADQANIAYIQSYDTNGLTVIRLTGILIWSPQRVCCHLVHIYNTQRKRIRVLWFFITEEEKTALLRTLTGSVYKLTRPKKKKTSADKDRYSKSSCREFPKGTYGFCEGSLLYIVTVVSIQTVLRCALTEYRPDKCTV